MLTIDDPEVERLIREEAERTGLTPMDVLRRILSPPSGGTAARIVSREEQARRTAVIREIQERVANLPVLDDRPMDELLGYDERGLPA